MKAYKHGVTNIVWRTDSYTVIKYFSPSRWTIAIANLFKTFFLDFEYFEPSESLSREIDAKKKLSDIGVKTPKIKGKEKNCLKMEYVEGENLRDTLENMDEKGCKELGRRKGEQLSKIHLFNYALIDSRLSNTIVSGSEFVSIDHELFTEHPSRAHKEFDLVTLETSARFLEPEKYRKFIEGFKEGYGDKFSNHGFVRMFLTVMTGIGFSIFGEKSLKSFLNGLSNWTRDLLNKFL